MLSRVRDLPSLSLRIVGLFLISILLIACQPIIDTKFTEDASTVDEDVNGLVASVVNAPITPDGNVAGAITDLVINLNTSFDPSVPGRSLLQGNQIKITFPDAFTNTGLPVATLFTPDCDNLQCSTGVFLQGWPQHPIFPMFPPGSGPPEFYTISSEGTHTIVFTALTDVTPDMMLPGPGIKQIHLGFGFVNPDAGTYDIEVVAETGPDGTVETGTAQVEIIPKMIPKINVTSIFNDGSPNTIYQKTSAGELTPLSYDFLLWDGNGEPMTGVSIEMADPTNALLKRDDEVVGHISIDVPEGATGQEIFTETPSETISAPISGVPAERLTAKFKVGSVPGEYTLTFTLNEGNSISMFVTVEEGGSQAKTLEQLPPEGNIVFVNDIEMYYEVYGEGPPLVLLHGFTDSSLVWKPFIPTFAEHYQLIVPDLRGHGRSTNPSNEFTHRQSALDIFALLEHLGIDQFKAIGTSTGAMTLMHMATQQPSQIETMVLVGSTPYFGQEIRTILGNITYEAWDLDRLREHHKYGDNQIRSLFDQFRNFKNSYDDMNFTSPYLSTITARTLIIHGDHDALFPIAIPVETYQAIPNSYLWIIPNGGHIPIWENKHQAYFMEMALEFLQGTWEEN